MGVLLIRLYEHRLGTGKKDKLNHVTVLEEAHNILKRASNLPISEDGPTAGAKAVEVLTKCITELRFTGEGFIIADQSPSEIDPTAIKNTSTKIAMRLHSAEDQGHMAAAMGLDKDQAAELSRLGKGAAVVLQEGWNEPVLTQFTKFESQYSAEGRYYYMAEASYEDVTLIRGYLLKLILEDFNSRVFDPAKYQGAISKISGVCKWKLDDYRGLFERYGKIFATLDLKNASNREVFPIYGRLVRDLLDCDDMFEVFPLPLPLKGMQEPYSGNPTFIDMCAQWRDNIFDALEFYCSPMTDDTKRAVLSLLLLADGPDCADKIRVHVAIDNIKAP